MNKTVKGVFDILWYLVVFALLQFVVQLAVTGIYCAVEDAGFKATLYDMSSGGNGDLLIISTIISSLLTLLVFAWRKWSPLSRTYLASHPWLTLIWTALLAFGLILPLEMLYESMQLAMPESTEALFKSVMKEPLGYVAVGVLAPIVEEMVFRGAVLRTLLNLRGKYNHWLPIALSALIFAVIHGNMAQGVHAFLMGLLLGWLYYRTSSIVPGIMFHWVNNTVAYLMFHIMPQMSDGKLIDLFHGSTRMMNMGFFFSMCIVVPAIIQLAVTLKKKA